MIFSEEMEDRSFSLLSLACFCFASFRSLARLPLRSFSVFVVVPRAKALRKLAGKLVVLKPDNFEDFDGHP